MLSKKCAAESWTGALVCCGVGVVRGVCCGCKGGETRRIRDSRGESAWQLSLDRTFILFSTRLHRAIALGSEYPVAHQFPFFRLQPHRPEMSSTQQAVRRWILTGAVAAITVTGTIYGAGLKESQDVKKVGNFLS